MGCGLTVLRTVGNARATKQWRWNPNGQEWSKISYQAGAWFVPREHQVVDLAGLMAVLEQVQHDPRAFVVRGALTPEAADGVAADPGHRIRRRKHAKGDVSPSLVEVPRRWIMVDIDNWPLPAWGDLVDDPEMAIDLAINELLPPAFHDAECWWQLSSSAGFAAGYLKVHLFFWLSEPATNVHIKAVLKQSAPGVDRAPFSAAQPHYIAAPIIEGGHDPLPRRTGWRKGLEQEVVLPELRPEAARPRPTGTGASGRVGDVMDALAFLGDGEDLDGFHEPIRLAIMRYAQRCNRYGERDDDALKADIQAAIDGAPKRSDRGSMSNYDDVYLQRSIDGAFLLLAGDTEIHTMRPHYDAAANTVEQARAEIARHVGGFLDRALDWHSERAALPPTDDNEPAQEAMALPEHGALVVDVGAGKSRTTREALAGFIAKAKLTGVPHRVLWLVPTHKLGNETLEEMRQIGLRVAVMRGREAWDPDTIDPEEGKPTIQMCLNIPAVEDAMEAGYDAEGAACGKPSKKKGESRPLCPYHGQCAYQRQKKPVAAADVVIASHQSLFHELPTEVGRGLGLIVVDESWWQSGLKPNRVNRLLGFADEVVQHPVLRKDKVSVNSFRYAVDDVATGDLEALSVKARTAFEGTKDGGFVSQTDVLATGLTADDCAHAHKLEWQRKREGCVYPGMPLEDRRKGVLDAAGNLTIPRRAAVWEALRELLAGDATHTGRLQLATRSDKDGSYRAVLLHTRAEIRDDIAALPQLHLDATMPEAVVRHYLPNLTVLAQVRAAMPHMRLHQVLGGWGKTSIAPSDKAAPDENRRRGNLVGELTDFVQANSGGNALVITYMAIEERFADLPGVKAEHFNNIAGLDTYGEVRSAFLIGRPLPDARHLREAALALTGRPIPAESGRMETRGALMADGTGAAIKVRTYADADLEALRVAITDAEVVQGIGRVRAINRTAATPVDVFLMADVVVPLPVHQLVRWEDVRLDVIRRMWARGAILTSPSDAAKAYPDLFPTTKAAEHALARAKGLFPPHLPRNISILGEWGGNRLVGVTYRPSGRGQQQRLAWVTTARLDSFREWLTGLLGELTVYTVGEPPPDSPPNAPRSSKPAQPPPASLELEPTEQEPACSDEPPRSWMDNPGWRPDATGPELAAWEAQFADAPPYPEPEEENSTVDDLQSSDRDQPGLDLAMVYGRASRRTLIDPIADLVRLPGGRRLERGDLPAMPMEFDLDASPLAALWDKPPQWSKALMRQNDPRMIGLLSLLGRSP